MTTRDEVIEKIAKAFYKHALGVDGIDRNVIADMWAEWKDVYIEVVNILLKENPELAIVDREAKPKREMCAEFNRPEFVEFERDTLDRIVKEGWVKELCG